jgi:hypothetical protein
MTRAMLSNYKTVGPVLADQTPRLSVPNRFAGLLLLLFLMPASLPAQSIYHHNVVWGRLSLSDTINARLRWELFLQHRQQSQTADDWRVWQAPQSSAVWPWLHVRASARFRVSVAPVAYFVTWPLLSSASDAEKPGVREWRSTLRLDYRKPLKNKIVWLNRLGLEQRWRDLKQDGVFASNQRIRLLTQLDIPLKINGLGKPLVVVISNEAMVQVGPAVVNNQSVFDQNRVYAGLAYGLSANVRASLGYIYWLQQRPTGRAFDQANVVWAVLSVENLFGQFRQ